MEIEHVCTKTRGCGLRLVNSVYAVSRGTKDGVLPRWVDIDPPLIYVPTEGVRAHFRGFIEVDLELILQGESYETYISGPTARRVRRAERQDPERQAYGMLLELRRSIGICAGDGLEALKKVHPIPGSGLGRCIRNLQDATTGKAQAESLRIVNELQNKDYRGALAAAWRLWFATSKKSRPKIKAHVALFMEFMNARADALALEDV